MNPVSIGDLAQSLLLRRANASARAELGGLLADLSAGQASDAARHLGGSVSPLLAIDSAISQARAFTQTTNFAAARATAMQTALARIDLSANEAANMLLSAASSGDPSALQAAGTRSRDGLQQAVLALNTGYAGSALFSGSATDTAPLPAAETILAAARNAVVTARTPQEASDQLAVWMASPTGFSATFRGNTQGPDIPVGPDETVRLDFYASDSELRGTFAGFILGALVAEGRFSATADGSNLSGIAGRMLLSQGEARSGHAARLGVIQSRIDDAASRNAAEAAALGVARNDLLAVDLYETSSRITATESRLEMIYTLTARLSRLSLTDYL